LIVRESGSFRKVWKLGVFDQPPRKTKEEQELLGKSNRSAYQNGVFDNDFLAITKRYKEFSNKLDKFILDPFMPIDIVQLLKSMSEDMTKNIKGPLQTAVNHFMADLCKRMSTLTENSPINFNKEIIYNTFLENYTSHNQIVEKVRQLIRQKLMIDK
jgi:hypothetical protein